MPESKRVNIDLQSIFIIALYLNPPESPDRKLHKKIREVSKNVIPRLKNDIDNLSNALQELRKNHKHEQNFERLYESVFKQFNISIFFRLSFLDIIVLYNNFLYAKEELEKQVFAKLIAMNIYEFFKTLSEKFGKPLAEIIETRKKHLKLEPDKVAELENVVLNYQKFLKSIRKICMKDLQKIRNNVAAHKYENSLRQIEILKSINHLRIEILCMAATVLFLRFYKIENIILNRKK